MYNDRLEKLNLYLFNDTYTNETNRKHVGISLKKLGLLQLSNSAEQKFIPATIGTPFTHIVIRYKRNTLSNYDISTGGLLHNVKLCVYHDELFHTSQIRALLKFILNNEIEYMQLYSASGGMFSRFLKWVQQAPKTCFFTGNKSRAYRTGGVNTRYIDENNEIQCAEGLTISYYISKIMKRCNKCRLYTIEHLHCMFYGYCPNCAEGLIDCASCGTKKTHENKCDKCHPFYNDVNSYDECTPPKFWFFEWLKGKLIKKPIETGGINKRSKTLYIGDEHEIELYRSSDTRCDVQRILNKHYEKQLLYTSRDGSLEKGTEIHTHPSTHKTHIKRDWVVFAELRDNGALSYNTKTAGLHFHLNRSAFSNFHFLKFITFINKFLALTLAIGRRKNLKKLDEYARFSMRTEYNVKRQMYKLYGANKNNKKMNVVLGGRGAINLMNANTIELRFFGGSLDEKYYKAKIDYIQSVYEYTYNAGLKSMNVTEFSRFVKRNKNRFKYLSGELTKTNFKRALEYPCEIPENVHV